MRRYLYVQWTGKADILVRISCAETETGEDGKVGKSFCSQIIVSHSRMREPFFFSEAHIYPTCRGRGTSWRRCCLGSEGSHEVARLIMGTVGIDWACRFKKERPTKDYFTLSINFRASCSIIRAIIGNFSCHSWPRQSKQAKERRGREEG